MEKKKDEEKTGLGIKIIKSFFGFLGVFFPFIKIIKFNFLLRKAQKVYNNGSDSHSYFFRQRLQNWILVVLTVLPLLVGVTYSYSQLSSDRGINLATQKGFKDYKRKKSIILIPSLIAGYKGFSKAINNKKLNEKYDTLENISNSLMILFIAGSFSFLVGFSVLTLHPLLIETNKLKKLLKNNGLSNKEEKDPIVLATPLGYLIDITGHRPREIKESESIWMALNVRIDDWREDPNKRALIFFTRSFELRNTYMYEYDEKMKPMK